MGMVAGMEVAGMEVAWAVLDTPIGPITLGVTERGLVRVELGPPAGVVGRVPLPSVDDPARLVAASRQLSEYFAGRRRAFELPLDWGLVGGFARDVLRILHHSVGFGQVVTYQELAERAGHPRAARAVGAAMGANPLPIVVPCHRVLAADGLGGFGGGLETKRRLLELEGVLPLALF
ncbi:MAG TPA: methylated-DNA--[protein]-cysteine S-methyltransferase [Mycobacteriales bacterium]|nr:methylated-DNA--[protein]-cysteine S-methyltransferase [Mycobacteriales bacterium]